MSTGNNRYNSRSRSRSPLRGSTSHRARSPHLFTRKGEEEQERYLDYEIIVSNGPEWSSERFREFIKTNIKSTLIKSDLPIVHKRNKTFILRFVLPDSFHATYEELSGKELQGKKLKLELSLGSESDDIFDYKRVIIKNAPVNNWEKVRSFIKETTHCNAIKTQPPYVRQKKGEGFCVKFFSASLCLIFYKEFNGMEFEGRNLVVVPIEEESPVPKKSRRPIIETANITTSDTDSNETYGLSLTFLSSLNITLPIVNRVYIGNLAPKVTSEKLREVFSLAGQVVSILMLPLNDGIFNAKIEFDHPVEAVQAVSMFHKRSLYRRPMTVQIDTKPLTRKLPEGLSDIGPGLGPNGEPLRGIRNTVGFEPLKQLVIKELTELKALKTMEMMRSPVISGTSLLGNPFPPVPPITIETVNPLAASSLSGMGYANKNWLQNAMGNSYSSMNFRADINRTTEETPNVVDKNSKYDPTATPSSVDSDNWQTADTRERQSITSDLLIFMNLPASVTVSVLRNKMSEIGPVVFAEITSQGRGVVRFKNTQDAKRCVELYDRSKVDGQMISVSFV